jgi:hypothetical protein
MQDKCFVPLAIFDSMKKEKLLLLIDGSHSNHTYSFKLLKMIVPG